MEARRGFEGAYDIKAVIFIRGVASPDGNRLLISTGGSMRLANLFEQAARRMGVGTRRVDEQVDLSRMLQASTRSGTLSPGAMGMGTGQKAPTIVLEWEGGDALSRLPQDTPDRLSEGNLRKAGQAISLALMALGGLDTY